MAFMARLASIGLLTLRTQTFGPRFPLPFLIPIRGRRFAASAAVFGKATLQGLDRLALLLQDCRQRLYLLSQLDKERDHRLFTLNIGRMNLFLGGQDDWHDADKNNLTLTQGKA